MAQTVKLLKVFVASPSDLPDERRIVGQVVNELNHSLCLQLNIYLQLVSWEVDATPGFGDDTQAVINRQIANDYDIFIGILHKRLGTPTLRAASGTEEEFQLAHARFRDTPDTIRILFYFKTADFYLDTEAEIQQRLKVIQFRDTFRKLGGLGCDFKTPDDFSVYVRMHLIRCVQEHGKTWGVEPPRVATPPTAPSVAIALVRSDTTDELEEIGLLDLTDLAAPAMETATASMNKITSSIGTLTQRMEAHAADIHKASTAVQTAQEAKHIINQAAETLDGFASEVEAELPTFALHFRQAIETSSKAIALLPDFGADGLAARERLMQQMTGADGALATAHASTSAFLNTFKTLPRLTTALNRSRRRAMAVIEQLLSEFDAMRELIRNVLKAAE